MSEFSMKSKDGCFEIVCKQDISTITFYVKPEHILKEIPKEKGA